jgi:hypothetical protein
VTALSTAISAVSITRARSAKQQPAARPRSPRPTCLRRVYRLPFKDPGLSDGGSTATGYWVQLALQSAKRPEACWGSLVLMF